MKTLKIEALNPPKTKTNLHSGSARHLVYEDFCLQKYFLIIEWEDEYILIAITDEPSLSKYQLTVTIIDNLKPIVHSVTIPGSKG